MDNVEFKFVKPKVVIFSTMDNRASAWSTSRANVYADITDWRFKDFAIHDLMQVSINFEHASIGFRELLMILRPYSSWAKSTREHSAVSQVLVDIGFSDEQKQQLQSQMNKAWRLEQEKDLDNGRLLYPLAVSVGFFYQTSFRMLMMLCKTLEKCFPKYYEAYGIQILRGLGVTDEEFQTMDYKSFHNSYMLKDYEGKSQQVGDYTYVRGSAPLSFVAQLVRQRQAKVLTNYYEIVMKNGELYSETMMRQDSEIEYSIMTSTVHYEQVAKYRSCNVFSRNLWNDFVHPWFMKNIENGTIENIYPCDSCKDKCYTAPEIKGNFDNAEFGYYPCWLWMGSGYGLKEYIDSHGELSTYKLERDVVLPHLKLKMEVAPIDEDYMSRRDSGNYAKSKLGN